MLAAPPGPHISSVLGWLQLSDPSARFSVGDATSAVVSGLNKIDPDLLIAYPSALARLLSEAAAKRLTIRPRLVLTIAEPTPSGLRAALEAQWDAAVSTTWAATEVGMLGTGDRLPAPEVDVEVVAELDTNVKSGKLARFVRLAQADQS